MSIFPSWPEWFRRVLGFFRRRVRVVLIVNRRAYELHPNRKLHLMFTVNVGHELDCSIGYLDTNGNPMLVMPTPDAPPVWTNAPAPAGATMLTVAPGGLEAVDKAVAAGTDTLNLTLSVGGVPYSASASVAITAAPQQLGSIVINAVVN